MRISQIGCKIKMEGRFVEIALHPASMPPDTPGIWSGETMSGLVTGAPANDYNIQVSMPGNSVVARTGLWIVFLGLAGCMLGLPVRSGQIVLYNIVEEICSCSPISSSRLTLLRGASKP